MSIVLVAKTPADTAEKARESLASLHFSLAYQYIIAGIVGAFVLRNLALKLSRALSPRRRPSSQSPGSPDTEKGSSNPPSSTSSWRENVVLRSVRAIDTAASTPVWLRRLGPEWTVCRVFLFTVIVVINIAFCLAVATTLRHKTTVNASVARAFSRQTGRMAVANLPILFATMGRNNPVSILTGIDYQAVRWAHKLIGVLVILESFIHTIAYTLYYVVQMGVEMLHEEYTEMYFKLGIVAMVAFATIFFTSWPWVRRTSYELFLVLHVVCAGLALAGTWYHRPIAVSYVYAAVGFWAWERLARLARHVGTIIHTRVILRRPLLQAEASVVSGAIVLSVPFYAPWSAGQHCYISFWGHELLAKPWLYGQSHPFSIASVPGPASQDGHTLHFILRIHDGITKSLATHISQSTKLSRKETCRLSISAEGPYGSTPHTAQSEVVLLVAGGSGVTHIASVLGDIVTRVENGTSPTTSVRFVWAIHHLDQARWLGTTLEDLSRRAASAGLDLHIDLYVTRPAAPHDSSETTTPVDSPGASSSNLSRDKLRDVEEGRSSGMMGAVVHTGRPDILESMRAVAGVSSVGHTAVLACGPTSMVHAVRAAGMELASSALTIDIASFEC